MKKFLRILVKIAAYYALAVAFLGIAFTLLPPVSTLMLARVLTLQSVEYESIGLEEVNKHVLRAVISAEDDQFCQHWGINLKSMSDAVKQAKKGKRARGASTISMQVAKNIFLWPQRSYIRKALEVPIALYLDLLWSKARMMEVYLTVAEWGDGVFGIESAAMHYFKKPASRLSPREAALLAAALPNPAKRNPARPSGYHAKYASSIQARMGKGADISCF